MTVTRAQVAFLVAAILFLLAFVLDLVGVATGRVRLSMAGATCLAVGLMISQ